MAARTEGIVRTNFGRYLDGPLRKALMSGPAAELLPRLRDLDLRIRDNALNFYSAGNSVVQVTPSRLNLHRKFAEGCTLPGTQRSDYASVPLNERGVNAFLGQLETILANVRKFAKPEARCEEQFVKANTTGTAIMVVDRQVRLPQDKEGSRLDLVAVTAGPVPTLVATELKFGGDPRIQDVPRQVDRYVRMLDPDTTGLKRDVAKAYQVALRQRRALGWDGPDPELIQPGMPVRGLLVLADYPERSKLLGRAKLLARTLHRVQFFVSLESGQRLPEMDRWTPLL